MRKPLAMFRPLTPQPRTQVQGRRVLAGIALLALLACGGGGGGGDSTAAPAVTVGLAYTDPPPTGWRWTRNATLSTSSQLVLELQGPGPALSGRGVVFELQADPAAVTWGPVQPPSASLVQNLAFNLGQGVPLLRTGLQAGLLSSGIFQKGQGNAVALNGALCRVVLVPAAGLAPARTLSLTAPSLQLFPETGTQLVSQACAVGTLQSLQGAP